MGMGKTRMCAMFACVLCNTALADVNEFDVAKLQFYIQDSQDPPASAVGYVFNSFIDAEQGDATSASINGVPLFVDGPGQWIFSDEFATQGMLDASYPSGSTYTLQLAGGSLGNRTEQVTLPMPEMYPAAPAITPTSFAGMQNADPTQDLTIEWAAPDASTSVVFMTVYSSAFDDTIVDDLIPLGQNSITIPAESLMPNDTYEVEIVFANAAIGSGSPPPGFGTAALSLSGYASITLTQFSTSSGLGVVDVDAGILKAELYIQATDDTAPGSVEIWAFEAFFDTTVGAIAEGEVTGGAFDLMLNEYSPGQWDVDDLAVHYESKATFDAEFPSNQSYAMNVMDGDLGARSESFFIGPDAYPAPGYLTGTVFSDLQGMDADTEFMLEWSAAAPGVEAVAIFIDRASDYETAFESFLPASSTGIAIPAGTLQPGVEYEMGLTYINVDLFSGSVSPGFGTDVQLAAGYLTDTIIRFTTQSSGSPCADLNNDGEFNFFDVSAFLVAYQSQDPAADFNQDGTINFFDVSAFLVSYQTGCP